MRSGSTSISARCVRSWPCRTRSTTSSTSSSASPLAIDTVYLGTCTGGRVKDFHEALEVLRGGRLAAGVRLVVAPASATVVAELEADGSLAAFRALGADIREPGCAGCCGTDGPPPASGSRVLSTANRNFLGRMGNREAEIVLASPRTCAQAALRGRIGDDAQATPAHVGQRP